MSNKGLIIAKIAAVATITANSIVKFGASDGLVTLATAAPDALVGVSTEIDSDVGETCDVVLTGIANVKLAGAVTRGGDVGTNAAGLGIAAVDAASTVGMAMQSGVAGDIIGVHVNPGRPVA